jgi:transposase
VAFLRSLDRKKVELVTIDMWTAYREAARANLPNAEIVVDKFHVIRYANDAVEIVRRALKAELSDSRRKGLKRDRYVLLRRPKDLDEREQLIILRYAPSSGQFVSSSHPIQG